MKKLFYKVIVLLTFLTMISCEDELKPIGNKQLMPANFNFVLLDKIEENSLLLNANSTIKMWYVADGKSITVDDIKVIPGYPSIVDKYKFYATSLEAPLLSAEKGIKIFYIEFGGKVGTLKLNVEKVQSAVERYSYKEIKYNDETIVLNANLPSLYLLKN